MFSGHPFDTHRFLAFTLVQSPLPQVDKAIETELDRIAPHRFSRHLGKLQLLNLYETAPPPGGAHLYKIAIYSPCIAPDCTLIMTNLADSWSSLSYLVSKIVRSEQLLVISSEQDVRYPMNRFELWRNGQSARSVMVMRDSDKWVFYERGVAEPFEEPELYAQVQKRKRLTRDILLRYVKKAGWDVASPDFWTATGETVYYKKTEKF